MIINKCNTVANIKQQLNNAIKLHLYLPIDNNQKLWPLSIIKYLNAGFKLNCSSKLFTNVLYAINLHIVFLTKNVKDEYRSHIKR